MKIALCLHGYFANAEGYEESVKAHKYLKRKVLDDNDVDVFIHSWDLENEKKVLSLYNPKKYNFEKQLDFKEELEKINIDNEEYKSSYGNTIFRTLSFLYSRMMAVKIKSDYEEEKKFKYDCVILARFDISRRGLKHHQTFYVTKMNFNPNFDMQYVYSAFWPQLNHGYADHWFYSCSENIDTVANLYYDVFEHYQSNSDYVKAVLNGWPESCKYHQDTNEFLKPEKYRSKELKCWTKDRLIDNHKLYKWHFMKTGLHQKSKFVDITTDTDKPRLMN
tara:strand:- start:408 stop:1238 length:831 start_codon:yes stop_codon:yes gene_type:complete